MYIDGELYLGPLIFTTDSLAQTNGSDYLIVLDNVLDLIGPKW